MAARLTQLAIEVCRAEQDGSVRLSQLVVEVLVPFVPEGPHYAKVGSASIAFHAAAARVRPTIAKSATVPVVFTPAAATPSFGRRASAAAALVLTPTTSEIRGRVGHAAATVVFRATTPNLSSSHGVAAPVRIVFRARSKDKIPAIEFGDDYLGRFELGQEVPLEVIVKDQHGEPADPTTATPTARVTNLDTRQVVEAVGLHHLRHARVGQVYARSLRLSTRYEPARYGVLYQCPVGGFLGVFLAIFEVVPGGDAAGPVIAAHVSPRPDGDEVLAQVGSGQLATGKRPRVT